MIPGIVAGQMRGAAAPAGDPYWTSVIAALNFDGAAGSTTLVDATGRPWTANNGAVLSDAQSMLGTTSLYLDGINDMASTPSHTDFNLTGTDATLDMWVHVQSGYGLVSRRFADATGWTLQTESFRGVINGVWSDIHMVWTPPPLNTWHHFAMVKYGTLLTVYIGGNQVGQKTGVTSVGDQNTSVQLGASDAFGEAAMRGHIQAFRWTRAARWTAPFTPPPPPFPTS